MTAYTQDIDAEALRLRALEASGLLHAPAPEEFGAICGRAKERFGVRAALVTLVAADRLVVKAGTGSPLGETPRLHQFCDHAIRRDEVMVVPDAALDPRFADHPLVAGPPRLRFYAGAPLPYVRGIRLGALCLLDTRPRDLDEASIADLDRLAEEVMAVVLDHQFDRLVAQVH